MGATTSFIVHRRRLLRSCALPLLAAARPVCLAQRIGRRGGALRNRPPMAGAQPAAPWPPAGELSLASVTNTAGNRRSGMVAVRLAALGSTPWRRRAAEDLAALRCPTRH